MNNKLLSLLLALVLVASFLVSCNKKGDSETTAESETATESAAEPFVPGEDENGDTVSISSENFTLTNADMSYFFYSSYGNVLYELQNSGFSTAMVGLDSTKSLKEQTCALNSEGGTWFDYIMALAKAEVSQMLPLCEAAKAEGISLDDEELTAIDDAIAEIKTYAESDGSSLEEYLSLMYGPSVKVDNVKRMLELTTLAAKYVDEVIDSTDVSDAVLEEKYQEYKNKYETFDYVVYGFSYEDLLEYGADEAAIKAAIDTTDKYISELSACTDKDSFLAYAKKHMVEILGMSEDEAAEAVARLHTTGVKYSGSGELTKWAAEAEVGDIRNLKEEDGVATLYLITAKNGRSEEPVLRSVRHILFMRSTYSTDEKVNEVYNTWVAGGASVDEFEALAAKYSEDPGSAGSGGLYEGVTEGQMVQEFNDWLFDADRQPGDHAIIESSQFGWHIMYYEGSMPQWKYDMREVVLNDEYARAEKEAVDKYAVQFDDGILATLPA